MSEAIIAALITGAFAVLTQVIIANGNSKAMTAELEKHQAVTETKIDELTREVREHNNFARRVPLLEAKVERLEQKAGI